MQCGICGNEAGNKAIDAREMMFGLREVFRYFECAACGCLQIAEIPADLSKYYDANYYAYEDLSRRNRIKDFLTLRRDRYAVTGRGWLGRLLYSRHPRPDLRLMSFLLQDPATRILDVGCGAGAIPYGLRAMGMKNILGADPFIAGPIEYANGLRIEKKEVRAVGGQWDLVTFHHSFEHIADQAGTLGAVRAILAPDGCCVIRTPTVSSHAWRHYGAHWVQLDAPRHLFLHSTKSMALLAAQAGMVLDQAIYDSTAMQFWGSEQYVRDIPFRDERSYLENPKKSIFSKSEIAAFARRAEELNANNDGDQAIFFLRLAGS
jgi:2-polyprenyl-3-methyl-5-hydroxy-6-metoxy-1,4-benzoquinol methylase